MMKKQRGYIIGILTVFMTAGFACQDHPVDSASSEQEQAFQSQQMGNSGSMQAVHMQRNFRTHLSGDEEVPPVDTRAQGQAIFQLSKDGSELSYKLIVANIENITQAHIHCGAAGVNGPVVIFLYPDTPPAVKIPGRFDGILAEGIRTNVNVIARPNSPNCPGGIANFDELIDKIRSGEAYVNVHTDQFPGGEIRGQIH